ncbi:lamin tail domain-containing protein, partial [bacterium]|nr:lamin tail domain-containing protein [bacterium]
MKTTLNWRILFRTDTEFLYAFYLAVFILAATLPIFSQVIFNEVMFDPLGSEYSDEFVEIVNLSPADSVDLTGWHLS